MSAAPLQPISSCCSHSIPNPAALTAAAAGQPRRRLQIDPGVPAAPARRAAAGAAVVAPGGRVRFVPVAWRRGDTLEGRDGGRQVAAAGARAGALALQRALVAAGLPGWLRVAVRVRAMCEWLQPSPKRKQVYPSRPPPLTSPIFELWARAMAARLPLDPPSGVNPLGKRLAAAPPPPPPLPLALPAMSPLLPPPTGAAAAPSTSAIRENETERIAAAAGRAPLGGAAGKLAAAAAAAAAALPRGPLGGDTDPAACADNAASVPRRSSCAERRPDSPTLTTSGSSSSSLSAAASAAAASSAACTLPITRSEAAPPTGSPLPPAPVRRGDAAPGIEMAPLLLPAPLAGGSPSRPSPTGPPPPPPLPPPPDGPSNFPDVDLVPGANFTCTLSRGLDTPRLDRLPLSAGVPLLPPPLLPAMAAGTAAATELPPAAIVSNGEAGLGEAGLGTPPPLAWRDAVGEGPPDRMPPAPLLATERDGLTDPESVMDSGREKRRDGMPEKPVFGSFAPRAAGGDDHPALVDREAMLSSPKLIDDPSSTADGAAPDVALAPPPLGPVPDAPPCSSPPTRWLSRWKMPWRPPAASLCSPGMGYSGGWYGGAAMVVRRRW